jgi:formylglycine-generating enzyme required for sulfatase activity
MKRSITLIFAILFFNFNFSFAQFRKKSKREKPVQEEYVLIKDNLYFGKYEVSLHDYFTFLNDLKRLGRMDLYERYKIDSLKIDSIFKMSYFAYENGFSIDNFPISNISYDAAVEFCKWKTDQYNNDSKRKFNKVIFRLPTESEWEFAARGGYTLFPYPWGPYLRGKDGRYLSNFKRVGSERITYNLATNKYEVIVKDEYYDPIYNNQYLSVCKINHFNPNNYGLYNICGNVAEMVAEKGLAKGGGFKDPGYDIRIISKKLHSKPSDDIGFRVVMVVEEKTKSKDARIHEIHCSQSITYSGIQSIIKSVNKTQ